MTFKELGYTPKLLIVDDDPEITGMLSIYFRGRGAEVHCASRGDEVLELCSRGQYDLIILDIMLPDINGYSVCIRLRKDPRTSQVPIIFLTQKDARSDRLAGFELGADDYITKPFDIEELYLRVQGVLRRSFEARRADSLHDRAIRILFLAANPTDTTKLRLDEEVRAIDQSLRQAAFRDRFDLVQQWAVRVSDLQSHLLRYKPDIVHFSGHGGNQSEIIFEDASGKSQPVASSAMNKLFAVLMDNVRCVVLNACYSAKQAKSIARSIDCVIGMSAQIGDAAAIQFSAAFYQALGYGRDVKTAFDLGCLQINLSGLTQPSKPRLIAVKTKPEEVFFHHHS